MLNSSERHCLGDISSELQRLFAFAGLLGAVARTSPEDYAHPLGTARRGADVLADSNPIADAKASQGVGGACSLDGLDPVADGVVEEVELAVESLRR